MVVGVVQLRFALHDVFSLKEKRSIVKRIVNRVRNKFSVAVAEVDDNDVLQSAVVGICAVGNERAFINSVLSKVIDFVDGLCLAEIVDQNIEILNL